MQLLAGLLVLLPLLSSSVTADPSLFDALKASGASEFASLIQSDPTVSAAFLSTDIGTIYAPADGISPPARRRKGKRDTNAQLQAVIQAGMGVSNISSLNDPPGAVQGTGDKDSNTGGPPVPVVSSPNAGAPPDKRWLISHRSFNKSAPILATLFSGLGNNVSITKGDIPYSGGIIHITTGYFTLPESLSSTAAKTGQTAFVNLTASTNLTSSLNAAPGITAFVPINSALTANSTSAYSSTSQLIMGHIIPNFVGYLPLLKDGATLTTQSGTKVTVSVRAGVYYINNAKIIGTNQILGNGVSHVIDQVITPLVRPALTAAGSSLKGGATAFALLSAGFAMLLVSVL